MKVLSRVMLTCVRSMGNPYVSHISKATLLSIPFCFASLAQQEQKQKKKESRRKRQKERRERKLSRNNEPALKGLRVSKQCISVGIASSCWPRRSMGANAIVIIIQLQL